MADNEMIELLEEAHEGKSGGHMSGEVTGRENCYRLGTGGTQCLRMPRNGPRHVMCAKE